MGRHLGMDSSLEYVSHSLQIEQCRVNEEQNKGPGIQGESAKRGGT
jgi:hypothetical protein